ncbi:MAG: M55 family metallopeptidase [Planctomycetota bacterium]|nr:M55 family metallopeptidase [Planctomycetota bacterium]
MKALVMTDLEGVAGVESHESQSYPTGRYHDQAKRLLTQEINAAVRGLVAEGIEDILVIDGHGPGGVWFEDLDPPAKLWHGRPGPSRPVRNRILQGFDISLMIGQHAMAGLQFGNQNHTQSSKSIDYYKLNGNLIGEIAQFAYRLGAYGTPLIFLSGDEAGCREAAELVPGITTVAVKEGVAVNAAISFTAPVARKMIEAGVRQAVRRHREKPIAPLKLKGPFVLEKRFFRTDMADGADNGIDVERVDGQTIRIRGNDILDVIDR